MVSIVNHQGNANQNHNSVPVMPISMSSCGFFKVEIKSNLFVLGCREIGTPCIAYDRAPVEHSLAVSQRIKRGLPVASSSFAPG